MMINNSYPAGPKFSGIKLQRTADSVSFKTRGRSGFKANSTAPTQASSRADSLSRRTLNETFFTYNLEEIDRRLKAIVDNSVEMSEGDKNDTKQIMDQASAPAPWVADDPPAGDEDSQKSFHYIRRAGKKLFLKSLAAKGEVSSSKLDSPFQISRFENLDTSVK